MLVIVGGVLLLRTTDRLPSLVSLWPLVPLLVGLVLLYYRLFHSGPDYYVFLGTSLLLTGLLLLVTGTVLPVALSRVWPVFMTVIGVALLLYGLRKHGAARVTFTIPAGAMILLSVLFLPFSLDLISTDFTDFVGVWWPMLLVGMGVALIFAHQTRRRGR